MIHQKRAMGALGWILIILILIAIGIGIYFWMSNGGSLPFGEQGIPQPPALPSG